MSATRAFWLAGLGSVAAVLLSGVPAAADVTSELKELHDTFCAPQHVATVKEAEAAQAKLKQWALSPDRLTEAKRAILLETEAHVALAVGDVVTAAEKLAALQPLAPEAAETWELAVLVSAAQGDAEAQEGALRKLAGLVSDEQRKIVSQRRRWVRKVGGPAPDVKIVAEDGTRVDVRERNGIVLVVDLWNMYDTTEAYAEALRALRDEMKSVLCVQFVGVNADGERRKAEAEAFAEKAGYTWPQCYEEKASRPPITHEAFGAGAPPWTVLVDGVGKVRAVGAVTDPAFLYAVRAVAREAQEKFAAGAKGGGGATAAAGGGGATEPRVGKGDLPSNDEAEALLRQARTYLRTGLKTKAKELLEKILREYPGTRQAREAEERLEGWH
ncbi:MAG: tetratricopeptide repeat protein [Phycisphaerae bacterium]|jgi:tetratricopeptide (TPR) repeat protein